MCVEGRVTSDFPSRMDRDEPAHRLARDDAAIDAERVQDAEDVSDEVTERDRALALRGPAGPAGVGGDAPGRAGQLADGRLPSLPRGAPAAEEQDGRAGADGDHVEAGLAVDLPVQRRKAAGRLQSARAKLVSLERKREYADDKIVAEVRDSVSAIFAASERVERAARNRERSEQLVELERFALDNGDSTLFKLNLREQDLIDSSILYYEALGEYFRAEASYRASLGESYFAP